MGLACNEGEQHDTLWLGIRQYQAIIISYIRYMHHLSYSTEDVYLRYMKYLFQVDIVGLSVVWYVVNGYLLHATVWLVKSNYLAPWNS